MADEIKKTRVLTYYLPIALWLEQQVKLGKKDKSQGAVCVGLSVPQGGGKTTISDCLEVVMKTLDIKTGVVSYDDFYMTYED